MNTPIEDRVGSILTLPLWAENSTITIGKIPDFVKVDGCNATLGYHKIFLYMECNRTPTVTGDFFVQGEVKCYRNNKPVIILPASIGTDAGNTLLQNSLISLFANNTSGASEVALVALAKNFTTSVNPILQPCKVTGIIDRLTFSIVNFGSVAGNSIASFRVFMAIVSSFHPF